MVSMRDLAIDLINDAKSTRDSSSKLYILEQIKEIIFHRDVSIIPELVPEIINFMTEKSIAVRKFLIKFAGEALKLSLSSTVISFVSLVDYLTSSDTQDNLLLMIAGEVNVHFVDIVMQISTLQPPKVKSSSFSSSSTISSDPKQLWNTFRNTVNHLISLISSDRSDHLRATCMKLVESVILFGLPPPPSITDPRLARAMKGEMSTTKSKNAEDIPLHHPFMNRNELIQESEDLYSKMLLWSSKNGPQNFPFSTHLVSLLGELIASVAVSRPKKGTDAAKAITSMIQSKSSLCSSMTTAERERLARASHKLIRISVAFVDSDGSIPKLRAALVGLEALGVTADPSESKKRSISQIQGGPEGVLDEEDEDQKRLRSSAIAAVDALESQRKISQSIPDTIVSSSNVNNLIPSTIALTSTTSTNTTNIIITSPISSNIVETELSAELANPIMDAISITSGINSTTTLLTIQSSNHVKSKDNLFVHVPTTIETYQTLSLQSFQRNLDCFYEMKSIGIKEAITHLQLMIRTALSLCNEIVVSEDRSSFQTVVKKDITIPIITAISYSVAKNYSDLPLSIQLPRSIWQLISFVLSSTMRGLNVPPSKKEALDIVSEKIIYLKSLCHTLYSRSTKDVNHKSDDYNNQEENQSNFELYNFVCYVSFARLLQSVLLRPLINDFLSSLPVIPSYIYTLLQILLHSGSKPPVLPTPAISGRVDKNQNKLKNRGTKQEALQIFGRLALHYHERSTRNNKKTIESDQEYNKHHRHHHQKEDEDYDEVEEQQEEESVSNNKALNYLLWACISEDFELRLKSVAMVVSDLLPMEVMKETIVSFALQSACTVVGIELIQSMRLRQHLRKFDKSEDNLKNTDIEETNNHLKDPIEIENSIDHASTNTNTSNNTIAAEDKLQVEGGSREQYMSILDAADNYDHGKYFDGSYHIHQGYNLTSTESIDFNAYDNYIRCKLHLLFQLCLYDYTLLMSILDIHASITSLLEPSQIKASIKMISESSMDSSETSNISSMASTINLETVNESIESSSSSSPSSNLISPVQSKIVLLQKILQDELSNIIPAIAQQYKPEVIFYQLMPIDPFAIPLLEHILQLLLQDIHIPATASMIQYVEHFVATMIGPIDISNENNLDTNVIALSFMIPLLGGYNIESIESVHLPRLIKLFYDKPDKLKLAFQRIVLARPPPISKVGFIVLLHRFNFEAYGIKQKLYLDGINACLNDITTFTGDTIKEAIMLMIEDIVLPVALVRTAFLASKAHNEVKKYLLSELIPKLIKKKIWATTPVHWEGVKHCVKNYVAQSAQNIMEPTLRALLGIPGPQLKSILIAAPIIKGLLSKLLKVLSTEEKEEVLSGRWAGLDHSTIETGDVHTIDNEKAKIIKELMTL